MNLCGNLLEFSCQAVLQPALLESLFGCLLETARASHWHARRRILAFLQVAFFRNLFTFPEAKVKELLLHLLADDQIEVRELASSTLSGLIQCGMMDLGLLKLFCERIRTNALPKRQGARTPARPATAVASPAANATAAANAAAPPATPDKQAAADKARLLQRHVGILGLQAFVTALPYSLAAWMPDALALMATCVNDPEPLRSTARKTLSEFWRTHQEQRQEMTELFSEDQLATITELMLSPSYYA